MMEIKVLGAGCAKCNKLEQMVIEVFAELNDIADIVHVKDFKTIASYGVMLTPALVVNGQVKLSGQVPSKDKLKEVISSELLKQG